MKCVKEGISENRVLSVGLMLLVIFVLIAVAAIEFYPVSVHADGLRGMNRTPQQIVVRLKDRLNLTDEQVKAIEPIIRDSMARRMELLKKMRQLQQSSDAKIIGILTREQAVEFQKIEDRRSEGMSLPDGRR